MKQKINLREMIKQVIKEEQLNFTDLCKLVDKVIEHDSALPYVNEFPNAKKAVKNGKLAIKELQNIGFLDSTGDVIPKPKNPVLKKLFKYFVDNAG